MSLEYVIFAGCAVVLLLAVGFVGLVIFALVVRWLVGLFRRPKLAVAAPIQSLAPAAPVSVSDALDAEREAKAKQTVAGINAMVEHLERQATLNARMKAMASAAGSALDKAAPPNA